MKNNSLFDRQNNGSGLYYYFIKHYSYFKDVPTIGLEIKIVYKNEIETQDFSNLEFVEYIGAVPIFKEKLCQN